MTSEYASGYLAALLDGEGCVYVGTDSRGSTPTRRVTIVNTDLEIIARGMEACSALGIEARVLAPDPPSHRSNKQQYVITISDRAGLTRLAETVSLVGRKQEKLQEAVASYLPEVPMQEVLRRYAAGEPASSIAKSFDRSATTILNRLHAAGVPIRQGRAAYAGWSS